MKKFMLLIATLMVMVGATSAFGGSQGSTILPFTQVFKAKNAQLQSDIYLSNITDTEVECTIHFYGNDGTERSNMALIYNGSENSTGEIIGKGNIVVLPAHSSRRVKFVSSSGIKNIYGYSIIQWNSKDDKTAKALVGCVRYLERINSSYVGGYILINNGQPF